MQVAVLSGNITMTTADAVVTAANEVMMGGGGVDGAIHQAAGFRLKNACAAVWAADEDAIGPGLHIQRGKRCPTGSVRPTPAFDLMAKWIFHAVGPVWPTGCENDEHPDYPGKTRVEVARGVLQSCYRKSLTLALTLDLKSIAFPAIGCGVYGVPHEECARIAAEVCHDFRSCSLDVRFYIYPPAHLPIWNKAMHAVCNGAHGEVPMGTSFYHLVDSEGTPG